ncbi:MAG: prephenate dehydratase [Planctomycetaceae bacterium]
MAKKTSRKSSAKQAAPKRTVKAKKPFRKADGVPRRKPSPGKSSSASRTPSKAAATAKSLPAEIHKLDREIVAAINRRAAATTELLNRQPDPQHAVFDPEPDEQLWRELAEQNSGPLPQSAVRGVFQEILSAAKRQVKTQRVAYLGPQFSFTHLAALERFGQSADLIPVGTIAAVFEQVNRGHSEYGIVPIENSTDGRVVDTLDMFTRLPLRICGEVQIAVHHNLLARCARSEITEIYSKPQALSQCREWLSRNMPQARLIDVTSTTAAAQLAQTKPGAAAVASVQAAVQYGLQVVAENIEDNAHNVTRFAVIGDEESRPTSHDRTAILLQIPHKPGSLADALVAFKRNKVNLTWIESFPLRGPESGYQFFLDFEGHLTEPRIKRTLADLEKSAVVMHLLGSYPRSEPKE